MEEEPQTQAPPQGPTPSSMEDNHQDLISILFPSTKEEEHKGTVKLGPDEVAYLSRLGSQGLESLMGEVARVGEELAIMEHQMRDMASQNYQIFVQSAQTTNLLKKSLSEAKQSVEHLSSSTFPSFKDKADKFVSSSTLQETQGQISSLFEKEKDIQAVLDMAWTSRRCLAHSEGDKMLPEAIKILHTVIDYKKSLEDEGTMPSVLAETVKSVLDLQSQIQSALLARLSSPSISLSECLQTIQLLRNFFPSDKALRFRFLQSRVNLGMSFDNSRSWIFDTLTQHRAAFGQDSSHYLSTFIALQLQRVITELQKQMEHGQHSGNLDSLFTNASYFGSSLARVGADMRGISVPVFAEFIGKRVSHDLLQAEMNFSKDLHQFNLSTCLVDSAIITDELQPSGGEEDLRPPQQLLPFHPLGVYCNEVITILNFVAKCPLPQLGVELSRKLNSSVTKVGHELEGWGQGEWVTWDLKEQNLFHGMRRVYEQLLVPHIHKCFRAILKPSELAKITGLGVAKCAELIEIKYSRPIIINS